MLRPRSVPGPYEDRIVMGRGSTPANGPHQGGRVSARVGRLALAAGSGAARGYADFDGFRVR